MFFNSYFKLVLITDLLDKHIIQVSHLVHHSSIHYINLEMIILLNPSVTSIYSKCYTLFHNSIVKPDSLGNVMVAWDRGPTGCSPSY